MATDPTPLADILPGILDYLEERRAWLTAGGARVDLPAHLAILGHELNRPREEACGYEGWRRSLRLAFHLAGVRRQPTLLLCRWSLTAVAMGLLAEATGFQHFRLVLGLVGGGDLTRARLAAEALESNSRRISSRFSAGVHTRPFASTVSSRAPPGINVIYHTP